MHENVYGWKHFLAIIATESERKKIAFDWVSTRERGKMYVSVYFGVFLWLPIAHGVDAPMVTLPNSLSPRVQHECICFVHIPHASFMRWKYSFYELRKILCKYCAAHIILLDDHTCSGAHASSHTYDNNYNFVTLRLAKIPAGQQSFLWKKLKITSDERQKKRACVYCVIICMHRRARFFYRFLCSVATCQYGFNAQIHFRRFFCHQFLLGFLLCRLFFAYPICGVDKWMFAKEKRSAAECFVVFCDIGFLIIENSRVFVH